MSRFTSKLFERVLNCLARRYPDSCPSCGAPGRAVPILYSGKPNPELRVMAAKGHAILAVDRVGNHGGLTAVCARFAREVGHAGTPDHLEFRLPSEDASKYQRRAARIRETLDAASAPRWQCGACGTYWGGFQTPRRRSSRH